MIRGKLLVTGEESHRTPHFRIIVGDFLDRGIADGELLGGERRPFFRKFFEVLRCAAVSLLAEGCPRGFGIGRLVHDFGKVFGERISVTRCLRDVGCRFR